MLANEALWNMASLALFSSPLYLVWTVAIVVGVWLLGRSRWAGTALIAAGVLEIVRLSANILVAPLTVVLLESGTLDLAGLGWFAMIRGLVSTVLVAVSHGLLVVAIFGWRQVD